MSSLNEVRRDSACSTRCGCEATNVPEPWRCLSSARLDQGRQSLAHRDAGDPKSLGDVALPGKGVERPEVAALDGALDALLQPKIERRRAVRPRAALRRGGSDARHRGPAPRAKARAPSRASPSGSTRMHPETIGKPGPVGPRKTSHHRHPRGAEIDEAVDRGRDMLDGLVEELRRDGIAAAPGARRRAERRCRSRAARRSGPDHSFGGIAPEMGHDARSSAATRDRGRRRRARPRGRPAGRGSRRTPRRRRGTPSRRSPSPCRRRWPCPASPSRG